MDDLPLLQNRDAREVVPLTLHRATRFHALTGKRLGALQRARDAEKHSAEWKQAR